MKREPKCRETGILQIIQRLPKWSNPQGNGTIIVIKCLSVMDKTRWRIV